MLPLQQPFGHEVASHTHVPLAALHSWPTPHAAQVEAPRPHAVFDSAVEHVPDTPPAQQPVAQVWASHEQLPLVVSQRPLAQEPQAAPPAPHPLADCEANGTHVLPLQQPFGQEVASHTQVPDEPQSWPGAHAAHAAPPVPHEEGDSDAYGSQELPLQQPFGQVVASHTHVPVLTSQRWPGAHAPQVAPLSPQVELFSPPPDPRVSQVEPLQQPLQSDPLQVHCPEEHAWPVPQEPHAAPPVPHEVLACEAYGTHVFPLQQPPGHELALQTHAPLPLHA